MNRESNWKRGAGGPWSEERGQGGGQGGQFGTSGMSGRPDTQQRGGGTGTAPGTEGGNDERSKKREMAGS